VNIGWAANISCPNTPLATISPAGTVNICQGDSVTLTASSANSYLWSNNATTQSITVSTSGNYSVTVTDGNGCSASSSPTTVTVNPLPTVSLTLNPNTVCINTGAYALTGGSPSGGIYSGVGVSGGNFNASVAGSGLHNIIYTYTDGNNCTNSDTAQIYVDVCTSVQSVSNNSSITIFPNPSNGQIKITSSANIDEIKITDLLGQIIYQTKPNEKNLSVQIDKTGVYFLQAHIDNRTITRKLVITK
jgi:hypothetical protein